MDPKEIRTTALPSWNPHRRGISPRCFPTQATKIMIWYFKSYIWVLRPLLRAQSLPRSWWNSSESWLLVEGSSAATLSSSTNIWRLSAHSWLFKGNARRHCQKWTPLSRCFRTCSNSNTSPVHPTTSTLVGTCQVCRWTLETSSRSICKKGLLRLCGFRYKKTCSRMRSHFPCFLIASSKARVASNATLRTDRSTTGP